LKTTECFQTKDFVPGIKGLEKVFGIPQNSTQIDLNPDNQNRGGFQKRIENIFSLIN